MIPHPPEPLGPTFDRLQRTALAGGVIALIVLLIAGIFQPAQFFRAYLIGFLMWSGAALGCFPLLYLHHLVGGGWGYIIRRILEAGTRTVPVVALLFVPLLFGLHSLYVWTHEDHVAAHELLQHKQPYLNIPFFIGRQVIYFGIWYLLAASANRWSAEQDRPADANLTRKLNNISGPGIIVYWVTVTFAAVDWAMSLEPEWFSSIFSPLFIVGQALTAAALCILVAYPLSQREPLAAITVPKYLNDLGNLLLMLLLLWAYMQFSQLLIIYAGNIIEEIPFYLKRSRDAWGALSALLAVLHFAVPFGLLLQRPMKRVYRRLAMIAFYMLAVRFLDFFWIVEPTFVNDTRLPFLWMNLVAAAGIGGVWLFFFIAELKKRPLVPAHDPRLPLVFELMHKRRVGEV